MIMKQRDTSLLLKNKEALLLMAFVVILFYYTCSNVFFGNQLLYKKLQGEYNAVLEQIYIQRSVDITPLSLNIAFKKSKVELPVLQFGQEGINYEELKKMEANSKGTWGIISQSPDSILIDAPASILKGKYAVYLQKEHPVARPPMYILILQNDSTRLCFSKVVEPYKEIDWE